MECIELLVMEHRRIERVLDALGAWAIKAAAGELQAQRDTADFVRFLREFADDHHHGKEEQLLFVAMQEAGMPADAGPIAVMLHEHDEGRALVKVLADAAGQSVPWAPDIAQRAAQAGQMFGALLRAHIHKEDCVLYPIAEQLLDDDALDQLDADADAHEEQHAARRAELELLGERLAQAYVGGIGQASAA